MGICWGSMKLNIFQMKGESWKQRGKIGGTARYGKWQDVMASDRKL